MVIPEVTIAPETIMGTGQLPVIVAGPCVIESEEICRQAAACLKDTCNELGIPFVFKASFDKANRTSVHSYRGPGMKLGLEILSRIREEFGVPVLTDIHEPAQAAAAAEVVDVLQIPAFLCRQTDLLVAAGETGKPINVKKGQFLSAADMKPAIEKVRSTGNTQVTVTERGTMLGYNNLVVDMRSLIQLAELGVNVVFDCTHSVQLPGGQGDASGGQREFSLPLATAAAAVGIQGLFMEVHPDPDAALCDGPNSIPLGEVKSFLSRVKAVHEACK